MVQQVEQVHGSDGAAGVATVIQGAAKEAGQADDGEGQQEEKSGLLGQTQGKASEQGQDMTSQWAWVFTWATLAGVLALEGILGQSTAKRGVGASYEDCGGLHEIDASWYYNWGVAPPLCEGMEAVPMVWCDDQVGWTLGGNSEWVLGMNEPDVLWQCGRSPGDLVDPWIQMEQAYPDRMLVSPAVMDVWWLEEWGEEFVARKGRLPRVDALGIHCYWWGASPRAAARTCQDKVNRAWELAQEWGAQGVWLTEFAHLCDQGEGVQYIGEMVPWLEAHSGVMRYAWFQLWYKGDEWWAFGTHCNTSLIDWESGDLNVLGERYRLDVMRIWLPIMMVGGGD